MSDMARDKTMTKSYLEQTVDDLVRQVAEIRRQLESTKERPIISRFKKPSIEEVVAHANNLEMPNEAIQAFYNYYESNGWRVGRNPMKSWKAALSNWNLNNHVRSHVRPLVRKETVWELTQKANIVKEEMVELKSFGGFTDAFGFHWSDETKRKRFKQLKVDFDDLQRRITET